MELGQYQLQIFVSLVVILAAAFVALICDFLKGNNEQLRELTVELKVRREEDLRRSQLLMPQPMAAPIPTDHDLAKTDNRIETRTARGMAASKESKRAVAPEALAAMERGAQLAGTPRPHEPSRAQSKPAASAKTNRKVAVTPQKPNPANKPVHKKDWNALLARSVKKPDQMIDIQVNNRGPVPAGFHDGFILSKLLQERQPVSGLVVSIGVNTPREANGAVPEAVKEVIQSLIGAGDFACQSNDEEFLLIYPNEQGASAQRKLLQIAQQLWDFQLRSMGTFSILFSWGGVEVASESIDEAIASANERMQGTRRGRKLLTMPPRVDTPLKQAV